MTTTDQEIVDLYRKTQSLKATARELCISEQKVRKLLITAGKYESERASEIKKLAEQGLSPVKIGERLKLAPSTVNSYLPYSRAPLTSWNIDAPRSKNAERIHKSRGKSRAE